MDNYDNKEATLPRPWSESQLDVNDVLVEIENLIV